MARDRQSHTGSWSHHVDVHAVPYQFTFLTIRHELPVDLVYSTHKFRIQSRLVSASWTILWLLKLVEQGSLSFLHCCEASHAFGDVSWHFFTLFHCDQFTDLNDHLSMWKWMNEVFLSADRSAFIESFLLCSMSEFELGWIEARNMKHD